VTWSRLEEAGLATILLFDIGNTHITLGVQRENELVFTWRVTTRVEGTADEYAALLRSLLRQKQASDMVFDGSVIASSVPPLASTFDELCRRYLHTAPIVVGPGIKTGLRIRTDSPREVGADRIANAVAAKRFYTVPAIVIDFSTTATIFDALNSEGDYVGTAIAPGVATSADALFSHASQLPRIELAPPASRSPIGKNTVAAIQAGLVYGYVGLVEGMVSRQKRELGPKTQVIGTGEMVDLIAAETQTIDLVDDYLTIKGLALIYEMNAKG
jgi:type III pantothenate kinase